MPVLNRLEKFLKEHSIPYKTLAHTEVFTAQEIAASMHVSGRELAKVVMIRTGDRYVMVVLPASQRVDIEKLRDFLKSADARLATEDEFKRLFPDCEPGAEPPFGNLYDIETIVDTSLTEDEHIYFNAGNHTEAVEMGYNDYAELVKPKVADIGIRV